MIITCRLCNEVISDGESVEGGVYDHRCKPASKTEQFQRESKAMLEVLVDLRNQRLLADNEKMRRALIEINTIADMRKFGVFGNYTRLGRISDLAQKATENGS